MKKILTLLTGVLLAASVSASPDISFTLGGDSAAVNPPLLLGPELSAPLVPQADFVNLPESSVNIAAPIVIPEPTAAALLLVSLAAGGLNKLRQRRNS